MLGTSSNDRKPDMYMFCQNSLAPGKNRTVLVCSWSSLLTIHSVYQSCSWTSLKVCSGFIWKEQHKLSSCSVQIHLFSFPGCWRVEEPQSSPAFHMADLLHVMQRSQPTGLEWRSRKACVHFTMGTLACGIRHHAGTFLKLLLHSRRGKWVRGLGRQKQGSPQVKKVEGVCQMIGKHPRGRINKAVL